MTAPSAGSDPPDVIVQRSFSAPAELVFDAWLDPDKLAHWMFDPRLRNEEVLHLTIEPRVGGSFSFLVRRDGRETNYIGRYLEISRPQRLVFTWASAPDSPEPGVAGRVSVDIVPRRNGCDLRLVHEMPPHRAEFADAAREAWTQELGLLARTLSPDA